jgi:hypothetical protein
MEKNRISKKNLLSLLKSNLQEMAMDFSTNDRPDQGVIDKLSTGETPHQKVPYPKSGLEANQNYQELLASERYRQVIQNLRRYTRSNNTLNAMSGLPPLLNMMMGAYTQITQIEREHREELEKLAVELVEKEMGVPDGSFQYDVKIVTPEDIDMSNFKMDGNEEQEEEVVNLEKNILDDLEHLNLEKAKRRFINSIIQGTSEKGHYMYHLISDKITEITGNNEIINLYGIMMSVNDINYWHFPDEMLDMAMKGGSIAGKEEVDRNTNPPTIKARGVNFPVLVHEIIKGIMEIFAIQGRSEDDEVQSKVEESEDTLEKEIWDLRLGPAIWDRIRSKFPEKVFEDNYKWLQNYILMEIFRLPAKEFFVLLIKVMNSPEEGELLMSQLVDGIESKLQRIETSHLYNDDDDQESSYDSDDDEDGKFSSQEESPSEFRQSLTKDTSEMSNDEINAYIDEMLRKKDKGN